MADKISEGQDVASDSKPVRALPPISHVVEPDGMKVMSTRIRWYHAMGYAPKEIYKFLGVRPQQVRNVITTIPKRAAREDLPSLEIVLRELDDDIEAMDKHFLEVEMAQQRAQDRKAKEAG